MMRLQNQDDQNKNKHKMKWSLFTDHNSEFYILVMRRDTDDTIIALGILVVLNKYITLINCLQFLLHSMIWAQLLLGFQII